MSKVSREICAFLAAVMLISLVACDSSPSPSPTDDVFIATIPAPELSLDAAYEGRVYVVNGCVYLGDEYVNDLMLPVFPEGQAQWADDALVYRGKKYVEGDIIEVSGGEEPPVSQREWASRYGVPEGCSIRKVWIVGAAQEPEGTQG